METAKADQTDLIAQVAKLTADLTAANALVAAANTAKADFEAKFNSAQSSITALTTERDALKSEVATLKSDKTTFEAAVAAKVATLGITDTKQTPAANATKGDKQPTLTEKVLAARGVKSLDELHMKMEAKRAEQNI